MTDGQEDGKGRRWCAKHGRFHGSLHACPLYSAEIRAVVAACEGRAMNQVRTTGIPRCPR